MQRFSNQVIYMLSRSTHTGCGTHSTQTVVGFNQMLKFVCHKHDRPFHDLLDPSENSVGFVVFSSLSNLVAVLYTIDFELSNIL